MQWNNIHSGVCAFVGNGSGLIESLVSVLQSEELKNGHLGFQSALVQLIRNTEIRREDRTRIRPQLISTLPVFVDFPSMPVKTLPTLTKQRGTVLASGIIHSTYMSLLGLTMRSAICERMIFKKFEYDLERERMR